ncbi:hypothetical protein BDR04DRAFT_1101091 [Suillus decipiens]|nr:hypothetical protein BDR04DRAFT_1101091 [Suillus decipiens]
MQRSVAGGQANEKDWWENHLMSVKTHPLKSPYSQLSLMQQMLNDYLVESRVSNIAT